MISETKCECKEYSESECAGELIIYKYERNTRYRIKCEKHFSMPMCRTEVNRITREEYETYLVVAE